MPKALRGAEGFYSLGSEHMHTRYDYFNKSTHENKHTGRHGCEESFLGMLQTDDGWIEGERLE